MGRIIKAFAVLQLCLLLVACGTAPEKRAPASAIEIAELAQEIMALGPNVDPDEAQRAARISYERTRELAIQYQITDPPLVHNTKVNMGLKPRGLCWHWAEDMEARLNEEEFETLVMYRAIANADNAWRIDHSTAIIAAQGTGMYDGIVLDPWRTGGTLFWDNVRDDTRYEWVQRELVLDAKRRQLIAEGKIPAPAG